MYGGCAPKTAFIVCPLSRPCRVEVEEERDTLEVADTHHQAAIAQLRKCLQIEKDGRSGHSELLILWYSLVDCGAALCSVYSDLEQKISAIAECEAQASVTSLEHSQKV